MAQISQIESSFFKLLIKCPLDRLQKLFHHLIDLFCGQNTYGYSQYGDVWTLIEWWDLISESKKFFLKYHDSNEKLDNSILSSEVKDVLRSCLEVRNLDLQNALIEKSIEISPAYLKDFDWKIKHTLSSDKMAQINEPRLILDLELSGNKNESVCLDLSKEELKALIESMEKANKALQEMTCE